MADSDEPKPKLIIDEDWKQQAQAEKEALAMKAKAEAAAPERPAGPVEPAAAAASTEQPEPLPPASLPVLFSTLATQALISLGQIAHPLTGKAELDLDHARHQIDMLAVLEDKTQGRRTPEENRMLDRLLHDLRMAFVAVQEHATSAPELK